MSVLKTALTRAEPPIPVRALHLDLKGVPPTPARLLSLLDIAAATGYNAVCVEWEDMFPWTVAPQIRCETAYTPDDIRAFAAKCDELGLEIIPLVQCMGHMQFVLKLPQYKHLREVANQIDVINPLAEGARELIQAMVDDVLALTPNVKHFHLGGDEAWSFGTHADTQAYVAAHGKGALYMHHVEPILDNLASRGIRGLLWHDMMREWDDEALKRLGVKADLVLWSYGGDPLVDSPHHISEAITQRFRDAGIDVWGASAYKGADGHNVDLPNYEGRQKNIHLWASKAAPQVNIKGVITTAWSRYHHSMCQVEPIDSALDSLVNHGLIMHEGKLPENGRDTVLAVLEELGERERFDACYDAMKALEAHRKTAWFNIQMGREEVITVARDKRRADVIARNTVRTLRSLVRKNFDIYEQVMTAFAGLIDPLWLDRYVAERIEPIVTETEQIETLVEKAYLWYREYEDR